ncbi:TPA: hypothetical protein N0F65_006752 [Lagenidium giganteum]|uniref:Uncharacterized protein n=1 Tax=Lagenidium giganteum TaxID=4803 RepID=A0AAV2YV00_9STRA|nr:TPA: hypothetical protein N0F65_006752 [Lagenidium giganteum]
MSSFQQFCILLLLLNQVVATSLLFEFDPRDALGIAGSITATYENPSSSEAQIVVNLDFQRANEHAIRMAAGHCPHQINAYEWHLHVKWSAATSSSSLAQCSPQATGNHYDPLMACGPSSEFADTQRCRRRVASYACSPRTYADNPLVCEKGDFSGKFGVLRLDRQRLVQAAWTDPSFPRAEELQPGWSIVLHAICGPKTFRVACARLQRLP